MRQVLSRYSASIRWWLTNLQEPAILIDYMIDPIIRDRVPYLIEFHPGWSMRYWQEDDTERHNQYSSRSIIVSNAESDSDFEDGFDASVDNSNEDDLGG